MSAKKPKKSKKIKITPELIQYLRVAVYHQCKRWDCETLIEAAFNKEIESDEGINCLAAGYNDADEALIGSDKERFIKLLEQWRDQK